MPKFSEGRLDLPPAGEKEPREIIISKTKAEAQKAAEAHQESTKPHHVLVYKPREFMCKEKDCGKAWVWNEKTHQEEALEHASRFNDNPQFPKELNEQPHTIDSKENQSKCKTCGEKWPKVEKENKKDEPFEEDPTKRKY